MDESGGEEGGREGEVVVGDTNTKAMQRKAPV